MYHEESLVILLFSFGFPAVFCRTHTLQYHVSLVSAPTPGVPRYSVIMYVDGLQYGRYNSDLQRAQALCPSLSTLSEHLQNQTKYAQQYEVWQRHRMIFLMVFYNKTIGNGDIHVYQRKAACELHDDGTSDGYLEIAFDGKEIFIFDKERTVYLPVTQDAIMLSHLWNKRYDSTVAKMYLENDCIEHMKLYLPYISTDLEKKVLPIVRLSSSESESVVKLHCWVYGFYPRDVEVKWIKNGRHEIYSEESPQILPNPDGTYQIRVSVEVTPEEGATYSCHVDHSSLEKILVVPFESNSSVQSRLYIFVNFSVFVAALVVIYMYITHKDAYCTSSLNALRSTSTEHRPKSETWI